MRLVGTRSADYIRASGQGGRVQRPYTWLHPTRSLKCQIFLLHCGRRPYMALFVKSCAATPWQRLGVDRTYRIRRKHHRRRLDLMHAHKIDDLLNEGFDIDQASRAAGKRHGRALTRGDLLRQCGGEHGRAVIGLHHHRCHCPPFLSQRDSAQLRRLPHLI